MTETANLPARRESGGMATIKDLFEAAKGRLAQVAPKHIKPERLMRVALLTISRTPALAKCTPQSLLGSFMTASQLGLEVGGVLGEAYLVPYKDQATFICGYRGFINLARRSGNISTIEARVVREGDEFEPPVFEINDQGPQTRFRHVSRAPSTSPIVYAYAVAKFKDGGYQLDVMTKDEIDAIRGRSRAGQTGPWVTDYAEMAKKTVVRRLCKYLPLSPEMADAIEASDGGEFGDMIDGQVVEASEVKDQTKRKKKSEQLADELTDTETTPAPSDAPEGQQPAPGPESNRGPAHKEDAPANGEAWMGDWTTYRDNMMELAMSKGITEATFNSAMKAALVRAGKVGHESETSLEWRKTLYAALNERSGVFAV